MVFCPFELSNPFEPGDPRSGVYTDKKQLLQSQQFVLAIKASGQAFLLSFL